MLSIIGYATDEPDYGRIATIIILILVVWCLVGGLVGYAIGNSRGRGTAGFWLGFLFGWVGWIIVAVLQPTAQAEAQRMQQLNQLMGNTPASPVASAPRASQNLWPVLRKAAHGNSAWLQAVHTAERGSRVHAPQPRVFFFTEGGDGVLVGVTDGLPFFIENGQLLRFASSRPRVVVHTLATGEIHQVDVADQRFLWPHSTPMAREFVARFDNRTEVVDEPAIPRPGSAAPAPSAPGPSTPPLPPPPAAASAGPDPNAVAKPVSVADALTQLEELRATGLLSDGEYTAKRTQILDRL